MHIEVPSVKYRELRAPWSIAARQLQMERFKIEKKAYSNTQRAPKLIRRDCAITADGEKLLENAVTHLGFSARRPRSHPESGAHHRRSGRRRGDRHQAETAKATLRILT